LSRVFKFEGVFKFIQKETVANQKFAVAIFPWTDTDSIQALFRYTNSSLNSTMQKEDSPSHQNVGIYMEY
jgi:hypothetical protein